MSDPVTNVQIEDVLSSIRRLVSTEDRDESESDNAQKDTPDALVLTPSLRVPDSDTGTSPSDTASAPDHDRADTTAKPHHEEQPTSDNRSEPDMIMPTFLHRSNDQERDEGEAEPDSQSDDHFEDHAEDTAEPDDDTAEQDVWTDEENTQDAANTGDDHGDDQGEEQHEDTAGQSHDHHDDTSDDPHHPEPDALTARVAGFEEAVAARDDGWEPDGDSDDDNAAQPMESLPWSEDDQAGSDVEDAEFVSPTEGLEPFEPEEDDRAPELEAPASAQAAAATGNAFNTEEDPLGDDEAILDEDALRDLVTDIVREELQGALGERITRNVRKLVRREIHRALATRELE